MEAGNEKLKALFESYENMDANEQLLFEVLFFAPLSFKSKTIHLKKEIILENNTYRKKRRYILEVEE